MIKISHMFGKNKEGECVINTCANGNSEWSDLSPFLLGPSELYEHNGTLLRSKNMENAWQYAKVYKNHTNKNGDPTPDYWNWALTGFAKKKADRYPMGKGAAPEYSLWNGEKLGYIEARKKIYVPLYARLVVKTNSFTKLKYMHDCGIDFTLKDWDGYDHKDQSLSKVLNNPKKKMGHAFVIKMLLTKDKALLECDI